eukprot:854747-Pleurochrysis_carterae.AAC.1
MTTRRGQRGPPVLSPPSCGSDGSKTLLYTGTNIGCNTIVARVRGKWPPRAVALTARNSCCRYDPSCPQRSTRRRLPSLSAIICWRRACSLFVASFFTARASANHAIGRSSQPSSGSFFLTDSFSLHAFQPAMLLPQPFGRQELAILIRTFLGGAAHLWSATN